MGGCQNYDPFSGTLHFRCRIIIGILKETIILTTTYVRVKGSAFFKVQKFIFQMGLIRKARLRRALTNISKQPVGLAGSLIAFLSIHFPQSLYWPSLMTPLACIPRLPLPSRPHPVSSSHVPLDSRSLPSLSLPSTGFAVDCFPCPFMTSLRLMFTEHRILATTSPIDMFDITILPADILALQ